MWSLSRRFPQKRAFVTGAASGLGEALCLALAQDGWTLFMADLREDALTVAASGVARAGGKPTVVVLDVTDRAAYAAAVARVDAQGGLDVLVNNAGVAAGGRLEEMDLVDWDWLYSVNVTGVVNGCHAFIPVLRRGGGGHIINVASAAALVPVPHMAAYCSAKAAVKTLSEVLHTELHGSGITVSVVMPEFFRTALGDRTRGPDAGLARHLLGRARFTAADVARQVLRKAGAGALHIVFPGYVRLAWWWLRAFPKAGLSGVRLAHQWTSNRYRKHLERASGPPP